MCERQEQRYNWQAHTKTIDWPPTRGQDGLCRARQIRDELCTQHNVTSSQKLPAEALKQVQSAWSRATNTVNRYKRHRLRVLAEEQIDPTEGTLPEVDSNELADMEAEEEDTEEERNEVGEALDYDAAVCKR